MGLPPDFGYILTPQKKVQERLAKLVPNAKHIPIRIAVTRYRRSRLNFDRRNPGGHRGNP